VNAPLGTPGKLVAARRPIRAGLVNAYALRQQRSHQRERLLHVVRTLARLELDLDALAVGVRAQLGRGEARQRAALVRGPALEHLEHAIERRDDDGTSGHRDERVRSLTEEADRAALVNVEPHARAVAERLSRLHELEGRAELDTTDARERVAHERELVPRLSVAGECHPIAAAAGSGDRANRRDAFGPAFEQLEAWNAYEALLVAELERPDPIAR
jgi:hypothetical protein